VKLYRGDVKTEAGTSDVELALLFTLLKQTTLARDKTKDTGKSERRRGQLEKLVLDIVEVASL